MKNIIYLLVISTLIVGGYTVVRKLQASADNPKIEDIQVNKPDLVITGTNLTTVDVWAIPTGTGVIESDYQKIGTATRRSATKNGDQEWRFPIPAEPILATEIFAKGFDAEGKEVGRVSLDEKGATELFTVLWDTNATSTFKDTVHGFTILYPAKRAKPITEPTGALLVGKPVARIDVNPALYSGTNLSEAAIIIGSSKSPVATASCLKPVAGETATSSQKIGKETFQRFTTSGAAAGNRYDTVSHRILRRGTCYEIQKLIHYGVLENYEPSVQEFDELSIHAELDRILTTFSFI